MTTADKEAAVRTAAEALSVALADAKAVGLDVRWPRSVDGLDSIEISETAKAQEQEPAAVVGEPVAAPAPAPKLPPAAPIIIPGAPVADATKG